MPKKTQKKISIAEMNILEGIQLIKRHPLFGHLSYHEILKEYAKGYTGSAYMDIHSDIYFNKNMNHTPEQWAYIIAHLLLHQGLGHTNPDKVPTGYDMKIWNIACDIYVSKFLRDVRFPGEPYSVDIINDYPGSLRDEKTIYEYLIQNEEAIRKFGDLSTGVSGSNDIIGLEELHGKDFRRWRGNDYYEREFAAALQSSVRSVLRHANNAAYDEEEQPETKSRKAAAWFINSYPLLGGIAAHFKVIEDAELCQKHEISIAAINVDAAEIYVNPAAGLKGEQLKFVLAHEYLHAGLGHARRAGGRDRELWNVACDYVINGWLKEMHIGVMPEIGTLYDENLAGMSAEEIYDELVRNLRTARKLATYRGYGKGDILGKSDGSAVGGLYSGTVSLDDYCKSALMQGLEYQISSGRGLIPAGLIEEIRALAMPPIPWDVQLAKWFDDYFAPLEKVRTYARPSRRQATTPDIPRPRYVISETLTEGRTFGVVIDTSGSMSAKDIGVALGAIASYADSKDVPKVRVVFCDAEAYDKGYMSPEEIAGRVEVMGRGGTVLQPGVDILEKSDSFPKDGPILIITDGYIESDLIVKRDHAFLIPVGHRLPFRPAGKVFYYDI